MELLLKRNPNDKATPDSDGDGIAEGKVMGDTAIPAGRYRIIIRASFRFKKMMIALVNVLYFTGILIHGGNTKEDTHGCILVGDQLMGNMIKPGTSTPAINRLFAKIDAALKRGEEVWITVEDGVKA